MGKIGVIGQGYVGSAIKVGFKPYYEVSTYDKFDISKSTHGNLNDVVNNSEKPAFYWLEQAAENGSLIAQLKYAKHIATHKGFSEKQVNQAFVFLKSYGKKLTQNADWFQTKGLLEAKVGKFNKAKQSLKRAIKMAKKAEWDIAELNQQLQQVINKKSLEV